MTVKLRQPGWYRAGWYMLIGASFAVAISWLVRMAYGHDRYAHFLEAELDRPHRDVHPAAGVPRRPRML